MRHLFVSVLLGIYLQGLRVCAHVSGRVYLGGIHVVEHHYGSAVVVQHQSPEVLYRVWQRVLGHYECGRLLVTLTKGGNIEIEAKRTDHKPVKEYTSCILYRV